MTKIGIIRHGSTAWNKEKRAQGSSNIPLDHEGKAQAAKLAERLKENQWDVIYSSNQLRASQTAEIIAASLGSVEVHQDSRIQEVNGGQIEGTTEEERVERWGENWRDLDLGIESKTSTFERSQPFFDEIQQKHSGQNILVVSHGGTIRVVLSALADMGEVGYIENTSLTKIRMTSDGWSCDLFNCSKHLEN